MIRQALRPLKRQARLTGAVLLLALLNAALEGGALALLFPLLEAPRSQLRSAVLALTAVVLLRSLGSFASELASARLRLAVLTDLRTRLLAAFHSIPFGEFQKMDPTSLPNLFLNQTQGCLSSLNSVLGLFTGLAVTLVYGFVLAKWRHASGWLLVLGLPLGALGAYLSARINRRIREHASRVTASEAELSRLLLDDLEGKAVVQSLGVAGARLQLQAHAEGRWGRNSRNLHLWLAAGRPAMDGLAAIALAGILCFGPWARDLPIMMGTILILYRLQGWLGLIHHSFSELSEHRQEVDNVLGFLERQPAPALASVPASPVNSLAAQDAGFSYGDERPALRSATLCLKRGEWVAVVGKTGSGKTTLSQLLSGLLRPQRGEILLDGQPLGGLDAAQVVGFASERPFLFNETLGWNIHCGRPLSYEAIEEAAKLAGILEFVLSLPRQFETRVGFRGMELSNGQRQRITLARALAGRPPLLILDEATSAVDSATEQLIHGMLRARRSETAVLLITHRMATAREADRIVVLDRGELVAQGGHDELLAESAIYRELCLQKELRTFGTGPAEASVPPAIGRQESQHRPWESCP